VEVIFYSAAQADEDIAMITDPEIKQKGVGVGHARHYAQTSQPVR
jgi:hypothetical protein